MGWIPVKERKSEYGIRVLVWVEDMPDFPRSDNNIAIGYRSKSGIGPEWYIPEYFGTVTHWMPLPPSPVCISTAAPDAATPCPCCGTAVTIVTCPNCGTFETPCR